LAISSLAYRKRLFDSKTKEIDVTKMVWGIRNRLAQLIQKDGRVLFLPIDHGYFQGPTHKLEKPGETIKPLLQYADAIMLTRGILRTCVDPTIKKPIILRVSGGTSVVGDDLSNEDQITSIREIIRLNASAVSMSIFIGSKYEHQTLINLTRLVDECEDYGIPVMAVTAVGRELEKRKARFLALCCRIAAELGARVVKTYYCTENFHKVIDGCPVPIVVAGGPKVDSEIEVFNFVYDALQNGAIGVNLGRNVWQSQYPVAMIRSLRALIHENHTPSEAHDLFTKIKTGKD
jgi:putative autoinducer-2 (AI-2) aldolase